MPTYTYIDEAGHKETISHRMTFDGEIICGCGLAMWRKPEAVTVTWGGLKPSDGDYHPEVQAHLDNRDESRAQFEQMHEEHENETS